MNFLRACGRRFAISFRCMASGRSSAPATSRSTCAPIVKVADREVKLSPKEYDLLRVLVQHAGKVLTHKFLLESCGTA
jgi:DNA-binding response OmpR family regulator